jgi:hypothetical protein
MDQETAEVLGKTEVFVDLDVDEEQCSGDNPGKCNDPKVCTELGGMWCDGVCSDKQCGGAEDNETSPLNEEEKEIWNNGYAAGQEACRKNPASCGIDVSPGASGGKCTSFDFINNVLHIPCLQGTPYWIDLSLTNADPVTLELKDYGEN